MKDVTRVEFVDALEAQHLLWPPVVVGGAVYAMHVNGELWRTTTP